MTTLVMPEHLFSDVASKSNADVETGGVLLASVVGSSDAPRLLAREMHWVPDMLYRRRDSIGLTVPSEGYVPALARAEATRSVALWVHTHPGSEGIPVPSSHDALVDQQLADLFRLRINSPIYGSLVFSPRHTGLAFTGRLQAEGTEALQIDRIWMVGDRLRLVESFGSEQTAVSSAFDRSVRALGHEMQRMLGTLRVAIVGCGGTGSAVAEQLVRLGVRDFTLVDPDTLSESNVTRVFGSTPADVGSPKVQVVARNLARIASDARLRTSASSILVERTALELADCDIVFGCTDDNAGRLVLSRMATYLLVPVIDSGVLVSSDAADRIVSIVGRVTTLVPGQGCLVCRDRIDLARAAAENLTPTERRKRQDEGYAPALGEIEAAVVSFTSGIASAAVNEFLERVLGFGPDPRPSEVLLRWHEREISTNVATPRSGHYCDRPSGKWGAGTGAPFLDQVWPR